MDELEYHVTFPTKFSKSTGATGQGNDEPCTTTTTRRRGDGSDPVIFLLGWYGAQDKHLAKYSAIYQAEGYITIRYILPHEYLFSTKCCHIRDVAVKILEAFFDLGLEENPIFFHVFSNGGGYVYRYITEIVNGPTPGQYAALKIAGVLCDSTPCKPTFRSGYRAMLTAMPRSQHWIINRIIVTLMWVMVVILNMLPQMRVGYNARMTYFRAMMNDRMSCPQLFLYSKADKIVHYSEIQEIIAERRHGGFEVREVLWDDSDHVAHLLVHRDEYVAACLEFVTDCVELINQDVD